MAAADGRHWACRCCATAGRARMVLRGERRLYAVQWWDLTMSRVIAVVACGFTLAACSMSMPSLDFFRSSPPTEVLRVESEPPGADARTAEGQSCRTPCELTVPARGEVAISFALQGYQPQTVSVRPEAAAGGELCGSRAPGRGCSRIRSMPN